MSEIYYVTQGPLSPTKPDADVYIKRTSDNQAYIHMQRMEYITLIAPSRQGKKSLIYRLMEDFRPQGYTFAWIDLSTLNRSDEVAWYQSIYAWALRNLQKTSFLEENQQFTNPIDGFTWLTFLTDIAEYAEKMNTRVIFVLDQVGKTPRYWATDFFSAIRSIYVQRPSFPCLNRISFIVAGDFNPRLLISDPNVSNFNVDHQVPLPDFTQDEIKLLVSQLYLTARQTTLITQHIYNWTEGQPNLVQCICKELAKLKEQGKSLNTSEMVNRSVQQFLHSNHPHLTHIQKAITGETKQVKNYMLRIWQGYKPEFVPAENHIQMILTLIGLIKEDNNGNCAIRNRIYRHILENIFENLDYKALMNEQSYIAIFQNETETADFDVFLCHNWKDKPVVKDIGEQLRKRGILPWLDEWELRPGFPWQQRLEELIRQVKSVAVFIGQDGMGPWQKMELSAFLDKFVNENYPVIPVLLPGAHDEGEIELSPFLRNITWVDFRKQDPDPIERLIWGITGASSKKD